MVYLNGIQKITPMDVSVSGTIDQKTYLKKFRGASAPLASPGSAYARSIGHSQVLLLLVPLKNIPLYKLTFMTHSPKRILT